MTHLLCPCCSGKSYSECCQGFHEGTYPENALLLMRSRYSAYACKKPEYIIRTTHPQNPHYQNDHKQWEKSILLFCEKTQFRRLEIVAFEDGIDNASVTFHAFLEQQGHDASFIEKSLFIKPQTQWLYLSGEMIGLRP